MGSSVFAQTDLLTPPQSNATGTTPDWTTLETRDGLDSCGAYFNNYIGLYKTSDIYFEALSTGNVSDFEPYGGRAQRFHANQPIEVSGLQFYAFQTNPLLDSLMVVTLLYDYDEILDSVGIELARDTVWVKHTEFTPLLTELEVDSYFDESIVVTEDYIVALYTSTNDSLKIITSDAGGDGDGEGVSFLYYNNPAAPSYTGFYNGFGTFGAGYDLDYLISPRVKFKLHDDFTLLDDSICPTVVSAACVDYEQVPNFSDIHYNRFADSPLGKIRWNWGDGLQNEDLTTLCHTYYESGTLTITLTDSIRRHDYFANTCVVELTKTIEVLDSSIATASFTQIGSTANFDGESYLADSVFWDFGDGNTSTEENPTHIYSEINTFDVWFYVYGPCNTDSVNLIVTTDDVSIDENNYNFDIYPNPSNHSFILTGVSSGMEIQIHSILGEEVYRSIATSNALEVKTSGFANGTYIINIYNGKQSTTKKLVIQH